MKASEFFANLAIATAPAIATKLFMTDVLGKFTLLKFSPESVFFTMWITFLLAIQTVLMFRRSRGQEQLARYLHQDWAMRLDLWMRMTYQGPFIEQICRDGEESRLYADSILRKLEGLAEYYRGSGDAAYCSVYIGCLAFCANEKRANVPWEKFRDALVANFKDLILHQKILPHVINDHYKAKWDDLISAARRKDAESRQSLA